MIDVKKIGNFEELDLNGVDFNHGDLWKFNRDAELNKIFIISMPHPDHYDTPGETVYYQLPECLHCIISMAEQWSENSLQSKLRKLIGVN